MDDKLKSVWIEAPTWADCIMVDDFLVAIGKNKSNSVYHVAEVTKQELRGRMFRQHLKVLKSDLITALRREDGQDLIPFSWNARKKKKTKN